MLKLSPLVTGAPAVDILRILWYRSEFFGKPAGPLQQAVMRGPSDWTIGERELFAAFISAKNLCRFCLDAHSAVAAKVVGHELVDQVLADVDRSDVSEKARTMMHFLEKLALTPEAVKPDDIAPLRAAGIRDEAIVDGIYVCTIFSTFNRLVDAFGCAPPTPKQMDAAAKILLTAGYEVP
jgi:uncharacterized peroxidase-related enzyme